MAMHTVYSYVYCLIALQTFHIYNTSMMRLLANAS